MNKEKFLKAFRNTSPLPIENIVLARKLIEDKTSRSTKAQYSGTVDDVLTDIASGKTRVRIYTPAGEGPFPAILFMHGGGFCLGSPNLSDNACRFISDTAEAALVSVDYALAPEHKFPFALEQCYQIALWLLENATHLNIRSEKLVVAGDSAGGNLAAGVCLLARQRLEFEPACQLLICPILDYRTPYSEKQKSIDEVALEDHYSVAFRDYYLNDLEDVNNPLVSPLFAEDIMELPPAIILTAGLDPLAPEAKRYGDRLRQAGIEVIHRHYKGVVHDFVMFSGLLDDASIAARQVGYDLRKILSLKMQK